MDDKIGFTFMIAKWAVIPLFLLIWFELRMFFMFNRILKLEGKWVLKKSTWNNLSIFDDYDKYIEYLIMYSDKLKNGCYIIYLTPFWPNRSF